MKIKVYILVLLAGCLCLNACQKNIDIFVPDAGQQNAPDTSWYSTITSSMPVTALKNILLQQPYEDTITVNANAVSISTPLGIQLNFPPNCCVTASGQAVTGKVQVEVLSVKKKGDMIRMDRPSTYNDSLMNGRGDLYQAEKRRAGTSTGAQYQDQYPLC